MYSILNSSILMVFVGVVDIWFDKINDMRGQFENSKSVFKIAYKVKNFTLYVSGWVHLKWTWPI